MQHEQLRQMFPELIVSEELHAMLARLNPALIGVPLFAVCQTEAEAVQLKLACARLGLVYGPQGDVLISLQPASSVFDVFATRRAA